ncbi:hypothetical protein ANN_28072 [Periplaneta americana]|uniref:DUF4817 domain-containing protein n=1 Tax=Periplaneta americana TaxID=6978 RepID=A0ABQ8RUS9_PERAM|nr:hypothetical protein ANN_28072 [Periplaneta americana]
MMWTPQERVFSVLGLDESKYVKRAQRNFRREFNLGRHDDIPSYLSIVNWDILLRETGSLLSTCGNHRKRNVFAEIVERTRMAFVRSPRKSI